MATASDAERVRAWVEDKIIQPAKARGERTVSVTAGEVHRELGLKNRVPLVCQALQSKRLLERNHLVVKEINGPPSGLSTTLRVTYEMASPGSSEPSREENPFWGLRGIAKDVFKKLGGGDHFILQERRELSAAMDERETFGTTAEAKFERVWQKVSAHAGERFETVTGKPFSFKLVGNAIRIEREGRWINQLLSQGEFRKAWERWPVDGPGELQDLRGPSFVFSILNDPRICSEGATR